MDTASITHVNFSAALHIAALRGDTNMVALLLKRGAKTDLEDSQQRVALDLALERSNQGDSYVKIVTMLRLNTLSNETKQNTANPIGGGGWKGRE